MNNQHKYSLDDLFREKFRNYSIEPPPTVWKNISNSIESNKKRKSFVYWLFSKPLIWLSLFLAILFIPLFLINNNYFAHRDGTQYVSNTNTLLKKRALHNLHDLKKNNDYVINHNINNDNITTNQNNSIIKLNNKTYNNSNLKDNYTKSHHNINHNINANFNLLIDNKKNEVVDSQFNKLQQVILNEKQSELYKNITIDTNKKYHKTLNYDDIIKNKISDGVDEITYNPPPDDYGKRNRWNLGLHFTPEIIVNPFYTDVFANNYNKYAYAFDITSVYDFSDFFVEGGIGVIYSLDKINYLVDYEKYVVKGSYEDVQIVTFDTVGNNIIPVYHTNTVYIYDTLKSTTVAQKSYTYKYLQLPFYIGYSHSIDRISYIIKGGVAYNYLLNQKEPELNYFDSDTKVLFINRKTPNRAKYNWNLLISVGINYKISNAITLSLEPSARIYSASLYDRKAPGTKRSPYAIGFKYGFLFNF